MKILLTVAVLGATLANVSVAEAICGRRDGCGNPANDFRVAPTYDNVPTYVPPRQPSPAEIAAQRSNEINNSALAVYQRGNYQEAARLYQQALQVRDHPQIRINLGRAQHMLGINAFTAKNYAEAIRQFEQALANNPNENVTRESLETARKMLANEVLARQRTLDLDKAKIAINALNRDLNNLSSGVTFDNERLPFEFQPPNNPQVSSSTNTAQNQAANENLFNKGDQNSAPVVTDRDPKIIAQQNTNNNPKTDSPPAQQKNAATNTNRTPLLTGPALEAAKDRAKAEAALALGMNLWAMKDYTRAKKYLEEALVLNPNCQNCRAALQRATTEDELNLLFGPDYKPRPSVTDHLTVQGDLGFKNKNDHVLTAFQYGKGDWDAGLRYLKDLQTVSPSDKNIQEALTFAQSLRTVVENAERTTR